MSYLKSALYKPKRIIVLLLTLTCVIFAQRAQEADLSTSTQSTSFATAAERVGFLDRYLMFPSQPKDAHYQLFYQDNSVGFPPGPSDWDMRIVVYIEPADSDLWLKNMKQVDKLENFGWLLDLIGTVQSSLDKARYFESLGKRAALLEDGVLALWYSTLY